MSFLSLSGKDLKLSSTDFTLFIRSKRCCENDDSAVGNAMYLQSPNYRNIKDLCSFQNYVEIYAYRDD